MKKIISASKEFEEISSVTFRNMVGKLSFEVKSDNPAFFEGHWWKKWDGSEASIYLSSHSGCPVGCKMCGTNRYHVREATAEEIVGQFDCMYEKMLSTVSEEDDYERLVVKFLYMGEPLLNVENVDKAIRIIADKYPNWIFLVSTTGPISDYEIVKGWLRDFGERILISFSIHKLDESDRDNLIPFKDKLTIQQIKSVASELYSVDNSNKISFSYNLFNREGTDELAKRMFQTFPQEIWLPCIQYLYDKGGKEDPEAERECNKMIDRFLDKLGEAGYEQTLGFYAPESSGESHLVTGCGQFVEFQKYCKSKNLTREVFH